LPNINTKLFQNQFLEKHRTIFAGNFSEILTQATMLTAFNTQRGGLIAMAGSITNQTNIDSLVEQGYRYLSLSRQRRRESDAKQAVTIKRDTHSNAQVQCRDGEGSGEVKFYR